MGAGELGAVYHARYFAHALTQRQSHGGVELLSPSLFYACVALNPHQIDAALFALGSPLSKGVILADEVGLGKTIEAGLLLCRLWAEHKRRLSALRKAAKTRIRAAEGAGRKPRERAQSGHAGRALASLENLTTA